MEKTIASTLQEKVSQRLKLLRVMTGLSRKDFSEKYSISPYTLIALELGRLQLSKKQMSILSNAFENEGILFSQSWILRGEGKYPAIKSQKLENEPINFFEELIQFKSRYHHSVVICVEDDSMEPFYSLGDYIGGLLTQDIQKLIGEKCLIKIGKKFIPRILLKPEENFIFMASNQNLKNKDVVLKKEIKEIAQIMIHIKSHFCFSNENAK